MPDRGLHQVCSRRHAAVQGARRRQVLPDRGLYQGSCYRRHAPLRRAWRRQALPDGGLHQVSRSSSRQHALHAMSAGHTAAVRRCGGAVTLSTRPVTQLERTRGDPAAGGELRKNQFTAEARLLFCYMYMYASIAMSHLTQPTVLGRQGGCSRRSLFSVDVPHKLRTVCE